MSVAVGSAAAGWVVDERLAAAAPTSRRAEHGVSCCATGTPKLTLDSAELVEHDGAMPLRLAMCIGVAARGVAARSAEPRRSLQPRRRSLSLAG
jgi:hypothetical protein